MDLLFYTFDEPQKFYDLQDYIIKNLARYIEEEKYTAPYCRSFYHPEIYYLELHLDYLRAVKHSFGLNVELLYLFYTSIITWKWQAFTSTGLNGGLRSYMDRTCGKETCCLSGVDNTVGFICYHRIIPYRKETRHEAEVANILPIEEHLLMTLEDTKPILHKYVMMLLRTFHKHYAENPGIHRI